MSGASVRTALDPSPRALWHAARAPLAVVAVLVLTAVAVAWANGRTRRGELDPLAVDDAGTRALATLLADRGVPVRRVRTAPAALAAADAASLTVLVHPHRLPRGELTRLARLPGPLVVVSPSDAVLAVLAPAVRVAGRVPVAARAPRCAVAFARVAGEADLGGRTFRAGGDAVGCYPAGRGPTLVRVPSAGRTVTVLGDGAPLTNGRLADRGNAALALGLFGDASRVVWLLPAPAPPPATDATARDPAELIPQRVGWALVQLGLAVVLLALWRARRLGPVVTEPLPVVVRSAEAVEGRARLYAAAGARDRAGEALRAGAAARLGALLGLPLDAARPVVARAAAAYAGRPQEAIERLLTGPPPSDDAALVTLADALDGLVQEVRRA
ncbi:MAG TPA: DUF4350 domain-containing protein [Mycobacteriales bacterium]|nr:DUF4350 domain-containing protein [Mycobacteriales bacterium]